MQNPVSPNSATSLLLPRFAISNKLAHITLKYQALYREEKIKGERMSDGVIESVVEKALSHFLANERDLGVNTLCAFFERPPFNRLWKPIDEVAMFLLIEVCVEYKLLTKLEQTLYFYEKHSSRERTQPVLCACQFLIDYVDARISTISADDESPEFAYLNKLMSPTALTKVGMETSTFVIKCVDSTIRVLLNMYRSQRPFGTNNVAAFLFCTKALLQLINKHRLRDQIKTLGDSYRVFCTILFEDRSSKSTARVAKKDNVIKAMRDYASEILTVRYDILETALKVGNWLVVRDTITQIVTMIPTIARTVNNLNADMDTTQKKLEKFVPSAEMAKKRFVIIAGIFLNNKNWLYHTQYMLDLLKFDDSVATSALLGTLCIPRDRKNTEGKSLSERNTNSITAFILNISVPSRTNIFREMACYLPQVHPAAAALFEMVNAGQVTDLNVIYKYLSELNSIPIYASYMPALELSLMKEYITNYFSQYPTLQLSIFANTPLLYPKENSLYDILIGCGATVNHCTLSATYPTYEVLLREKFTQLSCQLAQILKSQIPKRTPLKFTTVNWEGEATHISQRLMLNAERYNHLSTFKNDLITAEKNRKVEERKQSEIKEKKKHNENRKKLHTINMLKLAVAEEIERRRLVLNSIKARHPGLVFGTEVEKVIKNEEQFMEVATKIESQFLHNEDAQKNMEFEATNYREKLIRERDIPVRAAKEEAMESMLAKEKKQRIANLIEHHENTFEKNLALKLRLNQFRMQAKRYQESKQEKGMVTKRGQEQESLEDYKRSLLKATEQ